MAEASVEAATPRDAVEGDDEGDWDGAAEEEVMVLVDLPEYAGFDLFEGARSVEIRNLAGQGPGGGAGGRVELVLDGTRRFEGRYEDPLGTTLVVDGQGRGAGAGVAGDAEDDGVSDAEEEEEELATASGAASAADGSIKVGVRRGRRGAPVLAVANKVLPMYEVKSGEGGGGDRDGKGDGCGQLAAGRGGLAQQRGQGDEEDEEEEED